MNNSERLNVTITSTATVQIVLAVPYEMVEYRVESADGADSTTLTLGNLQPSTTYYMYENSLMNEIVFVTDSEGSHTYTQDLTQPHRIFIQSTAATTHINVDTTLTGDIIGSVVICANDIVLDLNGYSIISAFHWSGVGVSIGGKTGVTVKNGIIDDFHDGVSIGSGNTLDGVTIRNCFFGVLFWGDNYNTIKYGGIENSCAHGIGLWDSTGNEIHGNTISGNEDDGIFMIFSPGGNRIFHNNFIANTPMNAESWFGSADIWDDGYASGGNYWCDYGGVDNCSGPYQDFSASDGICDAPYPIPDIWGISSWDNYPLMNPWTQEACVEQLTVVQGGQSYPVQLVSTSTTTDITVTGNSLRFGLSGLEGTLAYVSAVLPVELSSILNVFLNRTKLNEPPYPAVTDNITHYFVYFAVAFTSLYEVEILFAPIITTVDQKQDALNLWRMGKWVTMYIELPEGYDLNDVDASTILLNSTIPIDASSPTDIGDYDRDGISDLMIKFDAASVKFFILDSVDIIALIEEQFLTMTFTLSGELHNGKPFQGSDMVKVIWPNSLRIFLSHSL